MDENALDTLLARQFPDLHVPTDFANSLLCIHVQLLAFHCLKRLTVPVGRVRRGQCVVTQGNIQL